MNKYYWVSFGNSGWKEMEAIIDDDDIKEFCSISGKKIELKIMAMTKGEINIIQKRKEKRYEDC
jgi:hypothetical protein